MCSTVDVSGVRKNSDDSGYFGSVSSYDKAKNMKKPRPLNTENSFNEVGSIKFHLSLLPTTRNFETVTKVQKKSEID